MLKIIKKIFQKTESTGIFFLDPELRSVIKELNLKEYVEYFNEFQVQYGDLPKLTPKELKQIIPRPIPRKRLREFIKKNFLSKDNGWEIDPSFVTLDRESKIGDAKGTFGTVSTGTFKVGISTIPIAVKQIVIDDLTIKRQDIINEVMVMAKLRHRNVVQCFGCWFDPDDDKTAFIAMELCTMGDLAQFLEANSDQEVIMKVEFLLQVAEGMKYVHSKEFVHRDLKLENVLVAENGTLKICDFGATTQSKKVIEGELCGSPVYIAPEMVNKKKILYPKLLDIYSFGVLMWIVICGKIPYEDLKIEDETPMTFLRTLHMYKKRPNTKTERGLAGCPEELIKLMEKCWAENPSDREFNGRPLSFDTLASNISYMYDAFDEFEKREVKKKGRRKKKVVSDEEEEEENVVESKVEEKEKPKKEKRTKVDTEKLLKNQKLDMDSLRQLCDESSEESDVSDEE